MMKKLAAFTLIELLIGMIISSLVVGFGYAAYTVIYKQYLSYKSVKETLMETTQLNTVLSEDMHNAEIISFSENTLLFHNKKKNDLKYVFFDDRIIRTDRELADTFKISANAIKHSFLFPENTLFVKQFSFEVNTLGEKEYFNFVKNYSAETLMNYRTLTETTP